MQAHLIHHQRAPGVHGLSSPLAVADSQHVRQRLNLRWGVIPFRMDFASDPETNIRKTFQLLKRRQMVGVSCIATFSNSTLHKEISANALGCLCKS